MQDYKIIKNSSKIYFNGSEWPSVNYGPVKIINKIRINGNPRYMVQFDDGTLKDFESSSIKCGKMLNPNKPKVTGKPPKGPKKCIDLEDHIKQQSIKQTKKIIEIVNNNCGLWVNGPYHNQKSLLTLECNQGHTWTTKAGNILTGRWCPKCAKVSNNISVRRIAHVRHINQQIEYITSGQHFRDKFNKDLKARQSVIRKKATRERGKAVARTPESRKKGRDKYREKYYGDMEFRVNERIKGQLRKCLVKDRPMGKFYELVGYTARELQMHIESLFTEGMSWDVIDQIHIDHVRPKSWFTLTDSNGLIIESEVKKCWSLSNLQPLWAKDNMSKHNRFEG